MNSIAPVVQQNCKLFLLLLHPHLNTLYTLLYIKQLKTTFLFLHKKWTKDYIISIKILKQVQDTNTWTTKTYFITHKNYQLTKYIQLTKVNSNSNRFLLTTNSVFTPSLKSLLVYNSWLWNQSFRYNIHKNVNFFLLNHFKLNHINLLIMTFNNFQKLTCSYRYTRFTNLIHNIKFL